MKRVLSSGMFIGQSPSGIAENRAMVEAMRLFRRRMWKSLKNGKRSSEQEFTV